ncbi:MAG: PH domain-containing protein [Mangrovibacterium sp.]
MKLFSSILGNSSEVSAESIEQKYAQLFITGETVEAAFKLFRDTFIFTNKRIILIDVQGVSGSKREYRSVAYKSISRFSIETAGTFDLDAELKIWVSSETEPSISKQFNKSVNVYDVQRLLAEHVLS